MVASLVARPSIAGAQQYYTHLKSDEYYRSNSVTNSRWIGRAAQILGLRGHVTKQAFLKTLEGRCPRTSARLVQSGRNHKKHVPGWDLTLSAPKAVSILWALAPDRNLRNAIEQAHKSAARDTVRYMEEKHTWCRRGKGGRIHENTAGLLIAAFTHHTSRNLDPQLHEHLFVLNMAPRKDATWGAIQSKPLFLAQKEIGAAYRQHLTRELNAIHIPANILNETVKISGISREQELNFSSRRQEILAAVQLYNYARTPAGFEKAALRTRRSKQSADMDTLHQIWKGKAKALSLSLSPIYEEMLTDKETSLEQTATTRPILTSISISHQLLLRLAQAAHFLLISRQKAIHRVLPAGVKNAALGLLRVLRGGRVQSRRPQQRHLNRSR